MPLYIFLVPNFGRELFNTKKCFSQDHRFTQSVNSLWVDFHLDCDGMLLYGICLQENKILSTITC